MFADFDDVAGANVDDGAADALGRLDDHIVVFRHLKGIEVLGFFPG